MSALREPHLFVAERLAVRGARVLLVGRPVCDVTVDNDERGTVRRVLERRERASRRSRSLASPTRVTFHPYAMNRPATSSLNASSVCPSIEM